MTETERTPAGVQQLMPGMRPVSVTERLATLAAGCAQRCQTPKAMRCRPIRYRGPQADGPHRPAAGTGAVTALLPPEMKARMLSNGWTVLARRTPTMLDWVLFAAFLCGLAWIVVRLWRL